MTLNYIFWPIVAHFLLVCGLYYLLVSRRIKSVKEGRFNITEFKIIRGNEPDECLKVARNISNQFEQPIFFHIILIASFVTQTASWLMLGLSIIYVALRYVHSIVHVTSNRLRIRRHSFTASMLVLVIMWGLFILDGLL